MAKLKGLTTVAFFRPGHQWNARHAAGCEDLPIQGTGFEGELFHVLDHLFLCGLQIRFGTAALRRFPGRSPELLFLG